MLLEFVVGLGIVCFLLIYFAFQLDKREHFLLQLLVVFFFLTLILLIPKALLDNKDKCQTVVSWKNESIISANETHVAYNYTEFCVTNERNTHFIFYRAIIWFLRIFAIYIFMYFNYVLWFKSRLIKWGIINRKK